MGDRMMMMMGLIAWHLREDDDEDPGVTLDGIDDPIDVVRDAERVGAEFRAARKTVRELEGVIVDVLEALGVPQEAEPMFGTGKEMSSWIVRKIRSEVGHG